MNRKQKKLLARIIISSVLLALLCSYSVEKVRAGLAVGLMYLFSGSESLFLSSWFFAIFLPSRWAEIAFFLVPYLIAGWDVLFGAVRNIVRGNVFDEKFLMSIATIGAFVLGEYPEAVFVMVFFQIGELFESIAVGRSRKSIAALMDIRPDYANLERDGALVEVSPEEAAVGDIIVIKPGERVPLDAVIVEGATSVDTAALTGESLPRDAGPGDALLSGCVNLSGLVRAEVTKEYGESTVSRILTLVEESAANKSRSETFITRFAARYTPAVVAAAVALAVLPSLITGNWEIWVHRALIFLVTSCPCALLISVPLTCLGGIGGASRRGILIKGSSYMDALAKTEVVVFDKTGTLTKGNFSVSAIHPVNCTEAELVETAALAEAWSGHPIAQSLKEYYGKAIDNKRVTDESERAGHGVRAVVDGREVLAGKAALLEAEGIACSSPAETGTAVHVAADGTYLGCVVISDEIKPDAAEAVSALKAKGVRKTVMLTGDRREAAEAVAEKLCIDEVRAELLPEDKVAAVEGLLVDLRAQTKRGGTLVFVGDGLNDAPVLSRADVGVAMGSLGTDAAIEAADVVLMDDKPGALPLALSAARRTKRIVSENIALALIVKFAVLALAIPGVATMWMASFADVGVCVIAVLNAMRSLRAAK